MKETKVDRTEAVLSTCPESRRDNRILVLRHWELEGLSLTAEQWAVVARLSQPETIRRAACKIKNELGRHSSR